ncbi:nucleotidyltransferase domain-containing protein [Hyalangium gracile]|uniref:nucleotidyltransferase domain-containing protein n=1 Tax=Hyalangium gracile TaxID=394092 RepID=UPI001CCAA27A|nr:nucleotidyltransferase [Hyalangium gracile]
MSFQPLFRRFHEAIQLKRFDENAELIEKRDRILKRLRDNLKGPGNVKVTFEPFNQGSYAMGTGIKPLNKDYDIDVGIELNLDYRSHDPVEVKGWVYKAIEGHTKAIQWRRPCITVYYQQEGEPVYHVDLAIMAKDPYTGGLRLAIGKENSAQSQREWQNDDRKGFMTAVENRFSTSEDAAQFRRVIRYLKRWKDKHFSSEGHAAPTGLSLTVAAYEWFQPMADATAAGKEYNDLIATMALVQKIHQRFGQAWDSSLSRDVPRLSLLFPKAPHDDVFARMTNQQMIEFHKRLGILGGWLEEGRKTRSISPLRQAFGEDFPEQ